MTNSTKKIIEKYWEAVNSRDWVTFENLLTEDVVYQLPQSREIVNGKQAVRQFNETYPGDWTLSVTNLVADGGQAISKITFLDNNEEQTGISFFELGDGLIWQVTEYWPTPYEPPQRNCDYIERY